MVMLQLYQLNYSLGQDIFYKKGYFMQDYYTIGEVSKKMQIPISTIRYYDKHQLLPFVKRNQAGIRQFDDFDMEILSYISCFKDAQMSLKEIKHYFDLATKEEDTLEERYEILAKQESIVESQIKRLQEAQTVLARKKKECLNQMKP